MTIAITDTQRYLFLFSHIAVLPHKQRYLNTFNQTSPGPNTGPNSDPTIPSDHYNNKEKNA